jgi:Family of unknown function (DUF6464)
MISILLILLLGLAPALFSIWVMRRVDVNTRLRLTVPSIGVRRTSSLYLSSEHHYVHGVGHMIGDLTCRFNARSMYIRCAVNPFGPCDNCSYYEQLNLDDTP